MPQSYFPLANFKSGWRLAGILKNRPGISVVVMQQFEMHLRQLGNSPECLVKNLPCTCQEPAGHYLAPSQCPASSQSRGVIIRRWSPCIWMTFFSSGQRRVGARQAPGGQQGYFPWSFQGYIKGRGLGTVIIILIRQWWQFLLSDFVLHLRLQLEWIQWQYGNLVAALAMEEEEQARHERQRLRNTRTPRNNFRAS